MEKQNEILLRIKSSVKSTDPDTIVILYGSTVRGDFHNESDIDLLILLNKDKVNRRDEKRVKYPLYDIEFESGQIISPLVLSKKAWETRHISSASYDNVTKEGVVL